MIDLTVTNILLAGIVCELAIIAMVIHESNKK